MNTNRLQCAVIRLLAAVLTLFLAMQVQAAASAHFQTSTPGIYANAGRLRIALPIMNVGTRRRPMSRCRPLPSRGWDRSA